MHARSVIAAALLVLRPVAAATKAPSWLELSWLFSWNPQSETYPIPTTAQCETLHITWDRSTATGPDGYAPYFLQLYASNYQQPFIIPAGSGKETDLTIPFAPGTQYEVCMFDSNNNTGGCQAIYSVYPNPTNPTPSCANLTLPSKTLSVRSEYNNGNLSEIGWVNSCTDIRVTPLEGTPPFTFTVAPALHPPLNITSNDMSPINWTVSLSWASPFFISLVDSEGLSWSNGPIHSGDGDTACLSESYMTEPVVRTAVAGGAAVAGIVFGSLSSILAGLLISKRRKRHLYGSGDDEKLTPFYRIESNLSTRSSWFSRLPLKELPGLPEKSYGGEAQYTTQESSLSRSGTGRSDISGISQASDGGNNAHQTSINSASAGENGQVYLIHHDSGRLVTSHGDQVVELPPGYSPEFSAASASTSSRAQAEAVEQTQVEGKSPAVLSGDT